MAADAEYQPKTYRTQGGDEFVVAASGVLKVESGGLAKTESGGTVEMEAASILDLQVGALFKDTTLGINTERYEFVDKKALTGTASTAGGVGSWTAPTGTNIIITGFYYDITAASATAGCVLDIGTTSASATTKSSTLIDGLVATGTITGVKNHTKHAGTNGVGAQKLTAAKWITVTATGSKATGLAGSIYVKYVVV